jgi:hypothetical protein
MNERLETLPEAEREAAEAEPLTCCLLLWIALIAHQCR